MSVAPAHGLGQIGTTPEVSAAVLMTARGVGHPQVLVGRSGFFGEPGAQLLPAADQAFVGDVEVAREALGCFVSGSVWQFFSSKTELKPRNCNSKPRMQRGGIAFAF